jgi:hypothetical protein
MLLKIQDLRSGRYMTDEQVEEGKRQLAAAIALLDASGLVHWDPLQRKMMVVDEWDFERKAKELHPQFGRVMLWVLFSTGSEYLLKAALILSGEFTPATKEKMSLELTEVPWTSDWYNSVINDTSTKQDAKDYKTIGRLEGDLKRLCDSHGEDGMKVRVAFKLLGNAIRNRDSHAYVRGVRAAHHHVVSHFAEAYTVMLSWLPS